MWYRKALQSFFSHRRSHGVVHVKTERNDSGTYKVHRAGAQSAALAFLRKYEVKQEKFYIIVETPEGNFGKDMCMIFNEGTRAFIEFTQRLPLPIPQASRTECARCGYPVIPGRVPELPAGTTSYRFSLSLESIAEFGGGFQCGECGNLACAACYRSLPDAHQEPTGEIRLTCWLCHGTMDVFLEPRRGPGGGRAGSRDRQGWSWWRRR